MTGIYLDGWAHVHMPELESFFTPWHGVLYSGYAMSVGVILVWTWTRTGTGKHRWRKAIPEGHALSLLGAVIFLIGGSGDLLWHEIFGIEIGVEALLSPTHLVLAIGAVLIVSGGARHFWATHVEERRMNLLDSLPLILSLAFTLAGIFFMTQFAEYTDPGFTRVKPGSLLIIQKIQALSVESTLLFSIFLTGTLGVALRRGRLPLGSITVILTLVVTGLALMREGRELIPAAFFAGLIGDGLLHLTDRRQTRRHLRLLSVLLPASYTLFSILILKKTEGVWLSVHLWMGMIVMSGIAGFLVSLVAWPTPRRSEQTHATGSGAAI